MESCILKKDCSQASPTQVYHTLLLVNRFVSSTTSFLNKFCNVCESKLQIISSKADEMEMKLSVLEARLQSVALDNAHSQPAEDDNHPSIAETAPNSDTINKRSDGDAESAMLMSISDHPLYAPYFKLLKIGVPLAVVRAKIAVEPGLHPELLDDPTLRVPLSGLPTHNAVAPSPAAGAGTPAVVVAVGAVHPVSEDGSGTSSHAKEAVGPVAEQAPCGTGTGDLVPACEHPLYAAYFKLLRVGVPLPVVQAKVAGVPGLDVDLLGTPSRLVALSAASSLESEKTEGQSQGL